MRCSGASAPVTLDECARHFAAAKGYVLAATYGAAKCSVQVVEVPVWFWRARLGNLWAVRTTMRERLLKIYLARKYISKVTGNLFRSAKNELRSRSFTQV